MDFGIAGKKVLITGGSGLLGHFLNKELSNHFNILTTYHQHIGNCEKYNSTKIDLTNFDLLTQLFESFNPNMVVHAAAVSQREQDSPACGNGAFRALFEAESGGPAFSCCFYWEIVV